MINKEVATVTGVINNPAVLSIIFAIIGAIFWFQHTQMEAYVNTIEQNKELIKSLNKRITNMYENSDKIERDVEIFVTKEYGSFSKRDEKMAKIEIRLSELDARLENIERALSRL